MSVALKDNEYHLFLVAFYISMLFGRQCDSGYILDVLPIFLPLRLWPSSINLAAAGLLNGFAWELCFMDPSGYLLHSTVSSFRPCPVGLFSLRDTLLASGRMLSKPLLRIAFGNWAFKMGVFAHLCCYADEPKFEKQQP
ncbi:hypothetical protein U1Q18_012971 [Sarracenia purpurea var. burkii]